MIGSGGRIHVFVTIFIYFAMNAFVLHDVFPDSFMLDECWIFDRTGIGCMPWVRVGVVA
jgi:hypothetical protein